MICERCGSQADNETFGFFDYCDDCGKNLCNKCMEAGCCGAKPARSGMQINHGDDEQVWKGESDEQPDE